MEPFRNRLAVGGLNQSTAPCLLSVSYTHLAYHQYQPLTKKGNMDIGSGFNDDPLRLIAAVYAYLGETGDYSILDEPVDLSLIHI